jgi:transcriptional regulator with XRE-family HTH domain
MNICDRLKEERERLGFDQEGFAALGGASRHSQIDWEKGKSFPNAKVLAAIAAAGADVQYILTGIRSGAAPSAPALNPRESALLDNYRHIDDEEGKRYVERSAQMAAKADKDEAKPGKKKRA